LDLKKYLHFVIVIALLSAFYFIAKYYGSRDKDFRIIDGSIQAEFNQVRMDYLNLKINQQQYVKAVKNLAKKENKLFEEVRNYKFENITESNYWHRGRLKFPSSIKMEAERLIHAQKDTTLH